MNPTLLLRSAQVLALLCVILFLPLSGISLGMSWKRTRRAFPRIALLLPCMSVVLALALCLYVMGQFAQTFCNLPTLLPDLLENENDLWLLRIRVENILYQAAFMAIGSLAYLVVFALCLIPGRGRSHAMGSDV
jgi:hypothetical protein